jgi:hypothetical protein
MSAITVADHALIVAAMDGFSAKCEDVCYTDTALVWDLLEAIRAIMEDNQGEYLAQIGCTPQQTLSHFLRPQEAP